MGRGMGFFTKLKELDVMIDAVERCGSGNIEGLFDLGDTRVAMGESLFPSLAEFESIPVQLKENSSPARNQLPLFPMARFSSSRGLHNLCFIWASENNRLYLWRRYGKRGSVSPRTGHRHQQSR